MPGETREETEAEIAAIFTRLRAEIAHTRGLTTESKRPLAARAQAERTWGVSAERPIERPPNRRGFAQTWVVAPIKRALRKLMRWYVEPVAAQQRTHNLTVLELIDELTDRVEALERKHGRDGAEDRG
jgi:hypothetical protein